MIILLRSFFCFYMRILRICACYLEHCIMLYVPYHRENEQRLYFLTLSIGVSPYHTLCSGFHSETYIDISLYHTLCCSLHYETYIDINLYHTLCSGFHYETYIGISPYHHMCSGFCAICEIQPMSNEWGICLKAHTSFIEQVQYFPTPHSNECHLWIL